MKKSIFFIALFFALSVIAIGCKNTESTNDQEQIDSVPEEVAIEPDSAENMVEPAVPDTVASEPNKDDEEFAKVVKSLKKVVDSSNLEEAEKGLKRLGFTGSTKKSTKSEYNEFYGGNHNYDVQTSNYTFTLGDKKIIYHSDYEDSISDGSWTQKITIEGDDEALDNFYKAIKNSADDVKKKGNTVIVATGWA